MNSFVINFGEDSTGILSIDHSPLTIEPDVRVVMLKQSRMLCGSGGGRSVKSLNQGSTFSWDGDGIEDAELDM